MSPKQHSPLPEENHRVGRLNQLAQWLDQAFRVPGTKLRVGWDGLIGLIPGIGDLITSILSLWIVMEAVLLHVPLSVATRMLGNVFVENVVGAVPVIGNFFDFAWKSNLKNVTLLNQYARDPEAVRKRSLFFIIGFGLLLFVLLTLMIAIPTLVLVAIVKQLS